MIEADKSIIDEYKSYIETKTFPCVAAKAALNKEQIHCLVVDHLACPKDDAEILKFIYQFIDDYRSSEANYHSAAIIFKGPEQLDEKAFDVLLWQRLQALSNLDALNYQYDNRVDADPQSPNFSFSLKEEAFYVIGLHSQSSRDARRFKYPTLVFNPHAQFEALREINKYDNIKNAIRKRDVALSGSINPMLEDFGEASEVYQYSGKVYDESWKCPLNINHGIKHNSAA